MDISSAQILVSLTFALLLIAWWWTLRLQRQNLEQKHTGIVEALELKIKTSEEYIEQLKELSLKGENAFKSLSTEALKSNNSLFLELARATFNEFKVGAEKSFDSKQSEVDKLVKPINDALKQVEGKLGAIEKERIGAYESLSQQVSSLVDVHHQLSRETNNLSKAMRTSTTRGVWGELQLKRVVEMSGMVEKCDFVLQESIQTESGVKRPDMIVRLPGKKSIIVDAKAPISHYLEALEAKDEESRQKLLDMHVSSLKRHIQQLSTKAYWDQFDDTPEFVVLFLPGEVYFSAALTQDPTLIEKGVEQKVILATPTTLIALLRSVAYGWQQEKMSENAKAISSLGRQMLKRITDFSTHFQDVGRHLKTTTNAYNRAVGSFDRRVLVSAKKFSDYGLKEADEIGDQEPIENDVREITSTLVDSNTSSDAEF